MTEEVDAFAPATLGPLRLRNRILESATFEGMSPAGLQWAMAQGFAFVAMGRALICDLDLPAKMQRGEMDRTRCTACNACIAAMDAGGIRCVLDDPGGGPR